MIDSTASALHRAILENPADDALRLIYIDCLRESGCEEEADYRELLLDRAVKRRGKRFGEWRKNVAKYCCPSISYLKIWPKFESIRDRKSDLDSYVWANKDVYWLGIKHGFIDSMLVSWNKFNKNAKMLFSLNPIQQVVFHDKQWADDYFSGYRFWQKNTMIRELWPLLETIEPIRLDPYYSSYECKLYKSEIEAKLALSNAAIVYGRQLVGLPRLTA